MRVEVLEEGAEEAVAEAAGEEVAREGEGGVLVVVATAVRG